MARRAFSHCSLLYDNSRRRRNKLSVRYNSGSGRVLYNMEISLQRLKNDGAKVTKADIRLKTRSVRNG